MKLSGGLRLLIIVVVVVGVGVLLVWGFMAAQKERAAEAERERPIATPLRVSVEGGEPIVTLDEKTQAASAVSVTPLQPVSRRERIRAYGTVVVIQDLIDVVHNYESARAQTQKTLASLDVARRGYQRLKGLNGDDRNISDKTLQAAEAVWRGAKADNEAAQIAVKSLANSLQTLWGPVLSKWVLHGGNPAMERLLAQRDVLVQVTVPGDAPVISAPQDAQVEGTDGKLVSVRLVSAAPRTDPLIQGVSFYFLAPATGLVPGMNVVAWLSHGEPTEGVIIPNAAVVWWQGKAWAYVQKDATRFARRPVPTDNPGEDGWFLPGGTTQKLVTSGAQMLFSEEFRTQVHVGD